jgi:hypothetical protein
MLICNAAGRFVLVKRLVELGFLLQKQAMSLRWLAVVMFGCEMFNLEVVKL